MEGKMSFAQKLNAFSHKLFGTKPNDGDVQPKEAWSYGITGIGQNFICTIIGSYLTVFMTDALGFNNAMDFGNPLITGSVAVAILMLVARIFDALNDPIMGSVVDYTRTKWGKCRPYLLWMPIPIGLLTILCFLPFYPSNLTGFLACGLIYVVWSVAYTIADVPYWGLSTTMTNNTTKRGNILTIVRLMCTAAAGIVTLLVPIITDAVTAKYKDANGVLLTQYAEENMNTLKWTYFIVAIVLVAISVPMFYVGFKNTKERFGTVASGEKQRTLGQNLKLLFKNDQVMLVVLSGILGGARMVYTYTGGLYFCRYALNSDSAYAALTMLVVPGGLIASLLCPWLTKKFTKKWSFIGSHLLGAAAMILMLFMWDFENGKFIGGGEFGTAGLAVAVVCMIIVGIPQGIANIMSYAMIGDTVEYLEWKNGERAEGICFSMQTFISKIGMAFGAFIGVMAYSISGIDSNRVAETKTVEGLNNLWLTLVLSSALSFIACVIPLFFYKITEDKQRWYVEEIKKRKESNAESELAAVTSGDVAEDASEPETKE